MLFAKCLLAAEKGAAPWLRVRSSADCLWWVWCRLIGEALSSQTSEYTGKGRAWIVFELLFLEEDSHIKSPSSSSRVSKFSRDFYWHSVLDVDSLLESRLSLVQSHLNASIETYEWACCHRLGAVTDHMRQTAAQVRAGMVLSQYRASLPIGLKAVAC